MTPTDLTSLTVEDLDRERGLAVLDGDERRLEAVEAEQAKRSRDAERQAAAIVAQRHREQEAKKAAERADRERKERELARLRKRLLKDAAKFDDALTALCETAYSLLETHDAMAVLNPAAAGNVRRQLVGTINRQLRQLLPHDFSGGPSYEAGLGVDMPLVEQLGGDA